MLQRVDAMESELTALVESLRTGANRLNADLSLLEGNLGELYEAAAPERAPVRREAPPAPEVEAPAVETRPLPPPPVAAAPQAAEDTYDDDGLEEAAAAPAPAAEPAAPAPVAPAPAAPAAGGDVEGARLVALNMALNGQPREETDRYLADNFDLADREGLLDEVYATVG